MRPVLSANKNLAVIDLSDLQPQCSLVNQFTFLAFATWTIMLETLCTLMFSQRGASRRINIYYFTSIRLGAIDPANRWHLRCWKKKKKGRDEWTSHNVAWWLFPYPRVPKTRFKREKWKQSSFFWRGICSQISNLKKKKKMLRVGFIVWYFFLSPELLIWESGF